MGIDGDRRKLDIAQCSSAVQSENHMDWTGAYVHTPEPGIWGDITAMDFEIPQCNYIMGLPSLSKSDILEFKQLESTNFQTYVYQQN